MNRVERYIESNYDDVLIKVFISTTVILLTLSLVVSPTVFLVTFFAHVVMYLIIAFSRSYLDKQQEAVLRAIFFPLYIEVLISQNIIAFVRKMSKVFLFDPEIKDKAKQRKRKLKIIKRRNRFIFFRRILGKA